MFYWPNFLVNLDFLNSNKTRVVFGVQCSCRQTQNPTEKETTLVNSKIHSQTTIVA